MQLVKSAVVPPVYSHRAHPACCRGTRRDALPPEIRENEGAAVQRPPRLLGASGGRSVRGRPAHRGLARPGLASRRARTRVSFFMEKEQKSQLTEPATCPCTSLALLTHHSSGTRGVCTFSRRVTHARGNPPSHPDLSDLFVDFS